MAGLIAVVGFAARAAVLLVRRYRELEADGRAFGDALVLEGTRDRFPAFVTSAVATVAALLPFVIAGDVAGMEFARPMAIALVGGIVTSVGVVLGVLPALYLRHGEPVRAAAEELVVVVPDAELPVDVEPAPGS
jgi:Cu/Ag efflux pump CusA